MKKKSPIFNVGKIYIDDQFTVARDEDYVEICEWGDGMAFPKLTLTLPGLKALYAEIGDLLREMEAKRNPR